MQFVKMQEPGMGLFVSTAQQVFRMFLVMLIIKQSLIVTCRSGVAAALFRAAQSETAAVAQGAGGRGPGTVD